MRVPSRFALLSSCSRRAPWSASAMAALENEQLMEECNEMLDAFYAQSMTKLDALCAELYGKLVGLRLQLMALENEPRS